MTFTFTEIGRAAYAHHTQVMHKWTYQEAIDKLSSSGLTFKDKEEPEWVIQFIMAHEKDDTVWQHMYERALRKAQDDYKDHITEDNLSVTLVRYYIELQGVKNVRKPDPVGPEESTPLRKFLKDLVLDKIINEEQFRCVELCWLVGSGTASLMKLAKAHPSVSKALRAGLSTHEITTKDAKVAECCLITGIERGVARENLNATNYDLRKAVEKSLEAVRMLPSERAAMITQAFLFPHESSLDDIANSLKQHSDVSDPEFDAGRKKYLIDFFKQYTKCSDDGTALKYLTQREWSMEATEQYRADALRGKPLSQASNADTVHPPDVAQDSIIVALVGTVDGSEDRASPAWDGWFLVDFYLWM